MIFECFLLFVFICKHPAQKSGLPPNLHGQIKHTKTLKYSKTYRPIARLLIRSVHYVRFVGSVR